MSAIFTLLRGGMHVQATCGILTVFWVLTAFRNTIAVRLIVQALSDVSLIEVRKMAVVDI